MTTARRWTVAGVVLAAAGVGAGLLFKWSVVDPAYTPLPDGHFGELYGPVSFIRLPVYFLCAYLVAAGVTSIASTRMLPTVCSDITIASASSTRKS